MTEDWRKLRIEELHDLCHIIYRVGEIEGRNEIACGTRESRDTRFWKEIIKRSDRFWQQVVERMIILKQIFDN